jgi:hypothetical protein
MSIMSMMNSLVSVMSESQTKDVNGYISAPILTTASNIPARFTILKPQQAMIYYGRYDSKTFARVDIAMNEGVIAIGNWIVYSGVNYVVISVINSGGQLNRLWACDVMLKDF